MTIVPMRDSHAAEIAAIEAVSFSEPWSETAVRAELVNPISHYFVAQGGDDAVLGYIGLHNVWGEGYITNVAVVPGHRREGIGTGLVAYIVRYAREQKLDFLMLEVRESNAAARALYSKFGFIVAGRRPGYYRAPAEDALLMTLTLGNQRITTT